MEFQFNVNDYFRHPIVEIRNTLLPPDFAGDRRALWNTVNKVAEVVNEMGEASAHAQGLNKPITTAERLRQSDQSLYLLVDQQGNSGNGAVTGMLKIGRKGLYVFDRNGQHYQVSPPCVLDFYVHEKRQRSGLGKKLFEHMLQRENVKPHNLAIDRPSEKFLNFLTKHYSLQSPIKQMNNYVVFDGFFPDSEGADQAENSPVNRTNGLQSNLTHNTPSYGRYGAPRPPCSMGQIIHNTSSQKNEPTSQNRSSKLSREYQSYQRNNPSQIPAQIPHNSMAPQIFSSPQNQGVRHNSQHQQPHNFQYQQNLNQMQQLQENVQGHPNHPLTYQGTPIQEQMRMFPEKEIHDMNIPYQYAANNSNSTPRQHSNGAIGNMWSTQTQPQQIYRMSQNIPSYNEPYKGFQAQSYIHSNEYVDPNTSQLNYGGQPYSNHHIQQQQNIPIHIPQQTTQQPTPRDIPRQYFQDINQQNTPQLQQTAQTSHSYIPQHHPQQPIQFAHTPKQAPIPSWSSQNIPYSQIQQPQMVPPQEPLVYQEHTPQSHPTYTQPSAEPQPIQEPLIPSIESTKSQSHETKQGSSKKPLKEQSTHNILHVESKYFKPNPINLRRAHENPMPSPPTPRGPVKDEETVGSLFGAEQEVFENGLLKKEYRRHREDYKASPQHSQNAQQYNMYGGRGQEQESYMRGAQIVPENTYQQQMQYSSVPYSAHYQNEYPAQQSQYVTPPVQQQHSQQYATQQEQQYTPQEAPPAPQAVTVQPDYNEQKRAIDTNLVPCTEVPIQQTQIPVQQIEVPTATPVQAQDIQQQSQQIEQNFEPQIMEDNAVKIEEPVAKSALNVRHSSFINHNRDKQPLRISSGEKIDQSGGDVGRRRQVGRQYGLNEIDMRRKGYQSAIIKRPPNASEIQLEYGYPPQVIRKRPPPRTVLTLKGN